MRTGDKHRYTRIVTVTLNQMSDDDSRVMTVLAICHLRVMQPSQRLLGSFGQWCLPIRIRSGAPEHLLGRCDLNHLVCLASPPA